MAFFYILFVEIYYSVLLSQLLDCSSANFLLLAGKGLVTIVISREVESCQLDTFLVSLKCFTAQRSYSDIVTCMSSETFGTGNFE